MADEDHRQYDPSPVNALPPVVIVLFLVTFGVEAILAAADAGLIGGRQGVGWRLAAQQDYGFSPDILKWMWANGRWPLEHLTRFVTYPFLHHGFTQMLIAGVMVLALGKFVGEIFGGLFVGIVFFAASAFGALIYALVTGSQVWLFGSFPAGYGLIGAFSYVLWRRYEAMGEAQIKAFSLIGVLLGLQLVFAVLFGGDPTWIAEIAGFVMGFGLAVLRVPGQVGDLIAKLRNR
jgi:membrane associated rhomboid family serine protease